MFTIIKELPEDILGILIFGKTTEEDYDRLNPIMEAFERKHKNIKLLVEIQDLDFTGKALWEDMKFGFKHLKSINAVAIVSDKKRLEESMEAFGSIIPGISAKGFGIDEVDTAIAWLKEQKVKNYAS